MNEPCSHGVSDKPEEKPEPLFGEHIREAVDALKPLFGKPEEQPESAKCCTDTERLDWVERHAQWSDRDHRIKVIFPMDTTPIITLREAIDAALASDPKGAYSVSDGGSEHASGASSPEINLYTIAWERIKRAAGDSPWMPKEYMMNDWVADVVEFLSAPAESLSAGVKEQEWKATEKTWGWCIEIGDKTFGALHREYAERVSAAHNSSVAALRERITQLEKTLEA